MLYMGNIFMFTLVSGYFQVIFSQHPCVFFLGGGCKMFNLLDVDFNTCVSCITSVLFPNMSRWLYIQ